MDSALLAYKLRKFAAETAVKKDPEKWEQAKRDAVASMGGKHSARAMQQAVKLYKERGGEYKGSKPSASQNSMAKWTKQDWQTRPGTPEKAEREGGSTARYLPKEKWDSLSKKEQIATDKKKLRSDEQYVANTRAAKVKGDADYYAKKASLERLRTAIINNGRYKQADFFGGVKKVVKGVDNLGAKAFGGLYRGAERVNRGFSAVGERAADSLISGVSAAERGVARGAARAKPVLNAAQLAAQEASLAAQKGLAGPGLMQQMLLNPVNPEAVGVATLMGAGGNFANAFARNLGLTRASNITGKLNKGIHAYESPVGTLGSRALTQFVGG